MKSWYFSAQYRQTVIVPCVGAGGWVMGFFWNLPECSRTMSTLPVNVRTNLIVLILMDVCALVFLPYEINRMYLYLVSFEQKGLYKT